MRKLPWFIAVLVILVILTSCTTEKSVKELKLDKHSFSLEVGMSNTLNLLISPENAKKPEIEWLTSDEKIASVDETGLVKANSIGKAIITAKTKNGKLSVSSDIIVTPKSVKGISLNKDSVTIDIGSNEKIEISIEPVDAGNQKVVWESSNTKFATIDENGTIKGVAAGTTDIIVRTEDGSFTDKCSVTIKKKVEASAGSNTNKSNSTNSNVNSIPEKIFKVTLLSPKASSIVKLEPLVISWKVEKNPNDVDLYSIAIFDMIPWVPGYTGANEPSGPYKRDLHGKVNPISPRPNEANGISSWTVPVSIGNFGLKKGHKYKLQINAHLLPPKDYVPSGPYKYQQFLTTEFTVEGVLDYPTE
ncbi:Ig-like domain-containing protein [Desulfosporosinus meridiei]|uniref:Ig-like domain-containing surface protein n=1 Tax=Desulfosporosinus meridiei (strain ATCC BAA-275 / DSM 13257 / KCTC 12902 / NCIMB 13706 / S10) TaxID=768704 RepID=J7IUB5_DESMD|nr:Ig-like domain-containing protein [Desulfosporosinus meridiei]AFQ43759.1 Ig-like domain-containing surface protein [Desulfosporosinus meridiei DSM 13257]